MSLVMLKIKGSAQNHNEPMGSRFIVVTGASGEIGKQIVLSQLELGIGVIAIVRKKMLLDFIPSHLRKGFSQEVFIDIADNEEINNFLNKLEVPPIGLVYGAAIFNRFDSICDVTADDWTEIFKINSLGAFLWNRNFAELCAKSELSGSVVNITSQAWHTGGYGGVIPYASSKGAMVTMTKGLAKEFAERNIRFNCVAPGFIETKAMRGKLSDENMKSFLNRVPMKKLGTSSDVANAVNYLLSDKSVYTTGSVIDVSGGQLIG
jgi:3-oxoacyl-[acyl-carrier protein] reductase